MKNKTDRLEFAGIDSVESLREKKHQIEGEIAVTKKKVSSTTERLFEDGAKVIAAGAFAFIVSRLLGYFMSSASGRHYTESTMSAEGAKPKDERMRDARSAEDESTASDNGHHSAMDTALIWLETLTGGLETAKIVLDHIIEIQDKVKEDRSKEKEEMEA
jgi:hypothetical protein